MCHRDVSVVESKAARKGRRKRSFTHHLDSSLVRSIRIKVRNRTTSHAGFFAGCTL